MDLLVPNRSQPRAVFDEEKLEKLSRSISGTGLIQPIVVRALDGDLFEIIAGERRWRAAQMAGLLRIVSREDYASWAREAMANAALAFDPSDIESQWGWDWRNR